jgi:hypothetical protein
MELFFAITSIVAFQISILLLGFYMKKETNAKVH